jgi:hypothetical protein
MILMAFILTITFIFSLRVFSLVLTEKLSGTVDTSKIDSSIAMDYFPGKEQRLFQIFSKFRLKYVFTSMCVSTMLLFTISANVSIWPNVKGLSLEDKQNSIAFRNFRGGSCINEFNALKSALDAAKMYGYETKDVIGILGEPSSISSNGTVLEYSLLPGDTGCKGIVRLSDGKVVDYSVEGCK